MLEYKKYEGRVEFDAEAKIFHGEVLNTRDVITFQGRSVKELERALRDSVDDYLEFARNGARSPRSPLLGGSWCASILSSTASSTSKRAQLKRA